MFIGHYAAAFIAATHPRAPRLGTLFVGAQLVDFAFFGLVLTGVEKLRLSPGITVMNPMDLYYMPYTHSLLGTFGWAVAFALLLRWWLRDWTASTIGAAVVVSHWFADLLVHRPDLTLWGTPPEFGLGLWNHPAIAMPLEAMLAFGALIWFRYRTRPRPGHRNMPLIVLALLMALMMIFNWFGPEPADASTHVAIPALLGYTLLAVVAWRVGQSREIRT